MTVLDFIELDSEFFECQTVQKVWGEDVSISVTFENENSGNNLTKEQKSLRGVVRPLGEKLKFVEENRAAINSVIMSAGLEGFSEADLKTLSFSWILFICYADTGNRELFLYFDHGCAALEGRELALTVHNDNTVTFDDLVEMG